MIIALSIETIGMKHLERNLAGVQYVEAWEYPSNLVESIPDVNDLPLKGVLVELVQREVASEAVTHKGVLVGKYYFDIVFLLC